MSIAEQQNELKMQQEEADLARMVQKDVETYRAAAQRRDRESLEGRGRVRRISRMSRALSLSRVSAD
jgi:hypothetical protein